MVYKTRMLMDYIHCPVLFTTTFRRLSLSPSSGGCRGVKPVQLGPVEQRMASSGMLRREALVRTDVSEEPGASFIRVRKIGELGTNLAVSGNRRTLRRNTKSLGISSQRASVASYS
jgi:hypothetical protein